MTDSSPIASAAFPSDDVEVTIVPRTSDLGDGFTVRRLLPSAQCRMVGPFVFFDQMGPVRLAPGHGLDVRPHPHIGLATVTTLFDGEILHRDSVGSVQSIRPGEVNWMVAGSGIVHSERTPPGLRVDGPRLSGLQVWVALPRAHEEAPPAFSHHAADALPTIDAGTGVQLKLLAGRWGAARSPVPVFSDTVYADAQLDADAELHVPAEHDERALHVVAGRVEIGDTRVGSGQMAVLVRERAVRVRAFDGPARFVVLGGEPMDGPRHLWWNFVSSSPERIEQAREDWRAGRFAAVPQETEFIPLPDRPGPVRYP